MVNRNNYDLTHSFPFPALTLSLSFSLWVPFWICICVFPYAVIGLRNLQWGFHHQSNYTHWRTNFQLNWKWFCNFCIKLQHFPQCTKLKELVRFNPFCGETIHVTGLEFCLLPQAEPPASLPLPEKLYFSLSQFSLSLYGFHCFWPLVVMGYKDNCLMSIVAIEFE